jgi:hypothetical protein
MIYEIVNPSDPVTVDAPTFEAALFATVLLGGGQYFGNPVEEGREKVPGFLFGGFDAWFEERYGGRDAQDLLNEHRADVVTTLRSACTGSVSDRWLFDSALAAITDPEKRAEFLRDWDDRKRTSLNDIAGRAHRIADKLDQEAAHAR